MNRNTLFCSTSARLGESMTAAARKKGGKSRQGMIKLHLDLNTSFVSSCV